MVEAVLGPIHQEIEINGDIVRVWEAVTGVEQFPKWFQTLEYRAIIGSLFYLQPDDAKRARGDRTGAMYCELEALDPPERMVFSWFVPGKPKTRVTVGLKNVGLGTTLVKIMHTGWDLYPAREVEGIRDELWRGYRDHVLPALKRVAERPTH
ncbi:MAG: SRPBCC domain-containing protein [Hyphomonadaceae bacterium]